MAFSNVNIGSNPDDGTGDPLRTAFNTINNNFANIANGNITVNAPVLSVAGRTGNITLTINDIIGYPFTSNTNITNINNLNALGNITTISAGNQFNGFYSKYSQGTVASPTAVQSGDSLGFFSALGYGASKFIGDPSIFGSGIGIIAAENFTDTRQGTEIVFSATPIGATTPSNPVTISANTLSVNSTLATNFQPGTGALVVSGDTWLQGNIGIVGRTTMLSYVTIGNTYVGAGSASALTVVENSQAPLNSNSTVHVSALNGATGKLTLESYNANVSTTGSLFIARTARGTGQAPTAMLQGDVLGGFIGRGYGNTSFQLNQPLQSAGMILQAAQNFSDTAQGINLLFNTQANNSITATTVMEITESANVIITGNLAISSTTGTPSNTTNPASWLKVTVGAGHYFIPLYQ